MVTGDVDLHIQLLFGIDRFDHRFVGGSFGDHDATAFEIAIGLEARRLLDHDFGAADKDHRRKGDLLPPFGVVGRRTALEIHRAGSNHLDPVLRIHRQILDLDGVVAQLASDLLDDDKAYVDRIANRSTRLIEIRKRDRGIAVADSDHLGILDFFQRAGELPGAGGFLAKRHGDKRAGANADCHCA